MVRSMNTSCPVVQRYYGRVNMETLVSG